MNQNTIHSNQANSKSSPPRGEDLGEGAKRHTTPHPGPLPKGARVKTGWTPERRARQSAAIRKWSPWTQSTGPRTPTGKTVSARNSYKHGKRSKKQRLIRTLLVHQARLGRAMAARAKFFTRENRTNELLDDPMYRMLSCALEGGNFMIKVLSPPSIMQKPCFWPPGSYKS